MEETIILESNHFILSIRSWSKFIAITFLADIFEVEIEFQVVATKETIRINASLKSIRARFSSISWHKILRVDQVIRDGIIFIEVNTSLVINCRATSTADSSFELVTSFLEVLIGSENGRYIKE